MELGDNVITKIACKIPIYIPCDKFTVKHYGGMWDPIKKKRKKVKQKYQKQHCQNYFRCGKYARVYFKFYNGVLLLYVCF